MANEWTWEIFGMSPNQWNVFKFLLIEFVVSVLIHKGYLDLLRSRVRDSLERNQFITLWSTKLGRLTPFEHIWWTTSCSCQVRGCDSCRMRRPRLLLIALNLSLLSLILLTEFGSGAEQRIVNDKLKGFGYRSEEKARSTHLETLSLRNLKAVHPDASCVVHTSNSSSIRPFDSEGRCPTDMEAKNETVSLDEACATITQGVLIKKACNTNSTFEFFGANRTFGFSRFLMRLKLTKDLTGHYIHGEVQRQFIPRAKFAALVEGFVTSAEVTQTDRNYTATLERRSMVCIVTWPQNTKEDEQKGNEKFGWTPQSCYVQHNGVEALFEVSTLKKTHRQWPLAWEKFDSLQQRKRRELTVGDTIPVRVAQESLIMRKIGQTKPVGTIVLLNMAEQKQIRNNVRKLKSSIRDRLLGTMTDDVVIRVLGFTEQIGEYEYSFRRQDRGQVAVVNVLFLAPMGLLLSFVIVLFTYSLLVDQSTLPFPLTYEEALDMNRVMFLKDRCERRTRNHASFRLASRYDHVDRVGVPPSLGFTEY